ncbi:MAG: ABC transporter permease [Oscillospiraceae bacterium]|nr:ABC transporter permease [Oscillospiraceae bacterium]
MLRFIFRKMLANRWMTACLIIGNLFLCSVASAIPVYTDATMNRVMQSQLEDVTLETGRQSGAVAVNIEVRKREVIENMDAIRGLVEGFAEEMELPVLSFSDWKHTDPYYLISEAQETIWGTEENRGGKKLELASAQDFPEHVEIVSGRLYETPMENGVIEAVVSETTMIAQDLLVGDGVELKGFEYQENVNWKLHVTGVYRCAEDPAYWQVDGDELDQTAFVDESVLETLFVEPQSIKNKYVQSWYITLDTAEMDARKTDSYIAALEDVQGIRSYSRTATADAAFESVLQEQSIAKRKLVVTLLILMVPIFVLLAFFIFMVSKQTLDLEKNTISVLESRGAGRLQIIGIFAVQSAVISLVSGAAGIPLGVMLAKVFGSTGGYMQFVRRAPLPVRLTPEVFTYMGLAVLVSMLTMLIPAVLYAGVSIVETKRSVSTKGIQWKKILPGIAIDLGLLGVSVYGLYTFRNQVETLAASAEKQIDPLIYLSSVLFIFSSGLLISQLLPLLIRLVFRIGGNRWKPAAYTSFLRVLRSAGDQRFIMIFLVLTVSIGVFNARTARTLESSVEDDIRYMNGTDVVIQEIWKTNRKLTEFVSYQEPLFSRYESLAAENPGMQVTRVMNDSTATVSGARLLDTRVMGIHTVEFGNIAYMRDGLLPVHWYRYLNAMANDSSAVLLSANWHTELGYELGDSVTVYNVNGIPFNGIAAGFVDYWPTYSGEVEKVVGYGETETVPEYLVVANIAQLEASWGVMPYEIWIETDDPMPVYDMIRDNGIQVKKFVDTADDLRKAAADPVLQGMYGFMTVGFVLVLLVCVTGFLIFWILSIRGRILQIGILRAMGMGLRELTGMLFGEQTMISLTSAAAGFGVGWIASELFAQLIQLSFAGEFSVLPLHITTVAGDCIAIGIAVAAMFAVCMFVLRSLIHGVHLILAVNRGED